MDKTDFNEIISLLSDQAERQREICRLLSERPTASVSISGSVGGSVNFGSASADEFDDLRTLFRKLDASDRDRVLSICRAFCAK